MSADASLTLRAAGACAGSAGPEASTLAVRTSAAAPMAYEVRTDGGRPRFRLPAGAGRFRDQVRRPPPPRSAPVGSRLKSASLAIRPVQPEVGSAGKLEQSGSSRWRPAPRSRGRSTDAASMAASATRSRLGVVDSRQGQPLRAPHRPSTVSARPKTSSPKTVAEISSSRALLGAGPSGEATRRAAWAWRTPAAQTLRDERPR